MKSFIIFLFCGISSAHAALSEIVIKSEGNQAFCEKSELGQPCRMNFYQAKVYCESIGGALPTVRELASWSIAHGAKGILETSEVSGDANGATPGGVPQGYYLVASVYEDGTKDAFYFSHEGYRSPSAEFSKEMFWTASTAAQNKNYAHVFYGAFGGGGGRPEEHHKNYLNAVLCSN